ncbi:MAG: class I SAM-dependent methyltransferase [Solirubrobacterales bacterium]
MVRVGFGEALPLEDDVFDCVLSQLVIQALDDPPLAAREMARVLAPGGVMATCVWDFRDGMPLLGAYWAAARAVDPEGARRAGGDVTNRWCTPEGLRRLWGGAGASDIEAGELSASAEYEGCDDAWWPFAAGDSASLLPVTRRAAPLGAARGVLPAARTARRTASAQRPRVVDSRSHRCQGGAGVDPGRLKCFPGAWKDLEARVSSRRAGARSGGRLRRGTVPLVAISTERIPSQYEPQAPSSVVANPTVRLFTPAMQLPGITKPNPITSVGTMKPTRGLKYRGFMLDSPRR